MLVKSGLHLDHDLETVTPGAVIPFSKLLTELIQTVKPSVFITTGTGGGIGSDVKLGDIVVAGITLFGLPLSIQKRSMAQHALHHLPSVSTGAGVHYPRLLKINGAKIASAKPIPGRPVPYLWSEKTATIVTSDKFAYDTANNQPYQLQGLGAGMRHGRCHGGTGYDQVRQDLVRHPQRVRSADASFRPIPASPVWMRNPTTSTSPMAPLPARQA